MNKKYIFGIVILFWLVAGTAVIVVANMHKIQVHNQGFNNNSSSNSSNGANQNPADSQNGSGSINQMAIQNGVKDILSNVRPCVVTVVSYVDTVLTHYNLSNTKTLDPYKEGTKIISSGLIINKDGLILTTKDAVPSNQIEVKLYKRKPNVYKANIFKVDNNLDLALLKINNLSNLTSCNLGDSNSIEVGDIVYAVGSPFGFSGTITSGIVGSNRKKIKIEGNLYKSLIQTDAVINEGNNGGPLVDIFGNVIGINSAIYSETSIYSGIGFAIPVNEVLGFIKNTKG